MSSLNSFEFVSYKATSEGEFGGNHKSHATVKIRVGEALEHRTSDGNGPVDALEKAIRKALEPHFPEIRQTRLEDYNVHISGGKNGAASLIKVLISFSNGKEHWQNDAVSSDILEATVIALDACFWRVIDKSIILKSA